MLSSANADLAARWSRLRGEQPTLRIRDAATTLGVSEAELVALGALQDAGSTTATPLAADWRSILSEMPSVGRVMCLTRNEHCVHERHGRFEDVQVTGPHGLVLGPDIDLRLFLGSWKHGFAVREPQKLGNQQGERLSLQFFDGAGEAVHKIYATDDTDRSAFDALIARHRAAAPAELTVTPRALRSAMEAASTDGTPIMIFVGSGGCIQIHSGPINRLVEVHGWFNVLDPAFNLHLREAGVARVFSVRKPTDDGVVTSIEAFCNRDRNILLMFGARKPGKPELEPWRSIVSRIEKQAAS